MLNGCEQAVASRFISFVQVGDLSTSSTDFTKYLTSKVFFVLRLCTRRSYFKPFRAQANSPILHLLKTELCSLSTVLIVTTKKIIY